MNENALPLRDLHLPDAIGWWPLAPGWWVLIALSLLGLGRPFRRDGIAVFVNGLEIFAIQSRKTGIFAANGRIRLGSGGNQD